MIEKLEWVNENYLVNNIGISNIEKFIVASVAIQLTK